LLLAECGRGEKLDFLISLFSAGLPQNLKTGSAQKAGLKILKSRSILKPLATYGDRAG